MTMSNGRRQLFLTTIEEARRARRAGSLEQAFRLLERAHVIGQRWIGPHLHSHWEMLLVGWLRFDPREVAGQLIRLALAVPGTWLGRLPDGNTGGADVNPFLPMPVEESLRQELERADVAAGRETGGRAAS